MTPAKGRLVSPALSSMYDETKFFPRGDAVAAHLGTIHPLGSVGQDVSVLTEGFFRLM